MNEVTPQEARIARLQERRGTPGRQHAQLHRTSPAMGTKIATTGFAAATIFGMVTAMTWTQHAVAAKNSINTAATSAPDTAAPASTIAPKVVVRVHHIKAGAKPPAHKVGKGIKPATPVKRPAHKPVVVAPVVKAPVSTCTATSTHACP